MSGATAKHVKELLRSRYSFPQWLFATEVRDRPGADATGARTADAVAMRVSLARGCPVVGFEIKVSRSDWLRELKDASKSEALQMHCDRWFVVAAHGIVREGELPDTWGLIETTKNGQALREKRAAPLLVTRQSDMDRFFVASFARKAIQAHVLTESAMRSKIEAQVRKEYERREATIRSAEEARQGVEDDLYELERLRKAVAAFEEASGISLHARWGGARTAKEVGAAIRLLRSAADDRQHEARRLRAMASALRDRARDVDAAAQALGGGFSLPFPAEGGAA